MPPDLRHALSRPVFCACHAVAVPCLVRRPVGASRVAGALATAGPGRAQRLDGRLCGGDAVLVAQGRLQAGAGVSSAGRRGICADGRAMAGADWPGDCAGRRDGLRHGRVGGVWRQFFGDGRRAGGGDRPHSAPGAAAASQLLCVYFFQCLPDRLAELFLRRPARRQRAGAGRRLCAGLSVWRCAELLLFAVLVRGVHHWPDAGDFRGV